jgi:molybdopterin-guanine dinucleotide biosynthesis protein A
MRSTGGVVLCGGRSSRMGRPKAWLPVGGELMLQRVVGVVSEAVGPVVVVAAPGQDVPPLPAGVRVVRDEVDGRGPLGGLAAGLAALSGECERAYLSGCDVPLLRSGFVRRVVTPLSPGGRGVGGEGGQITMPRIAGRLHPLAAAYSLDVLPVVLAQLAADDLRMTRLAELVPTRFLTEADFADVDPELESLRNVNTWAEYEKIKSATDGHG